MGGKGRGVRPPGNFGGRRGYERQPAAQQQSRNQAPGQNFCVHASFYVNRPVQSMRWVGNGRGGGKAVQPMPGREDQGANPSFFATSLSLLSRVQRATPVNLAEASKCISMYPRPFPIRP